VHSRIKIYVATRGWRMATRLMAIVLGASLSLFAQNTNPNQSSKATGHGKNQVTARGCLMKVSADYVLDQPDQGNSYELQGSRKIKLRSYLGQEVEVAGEESPSMSTSSDYLARSGSPSAVTITVRSIKTLAKRCSSY
jgi:hypothetical protein